MSNNQVKVRYRQARARIRAGADRFFGDPPLENKGRMQSSAGGFQKSQGQEGYGDIEEGPEDDLRKESFRDFRKDLQDNREDGL